MAKEKKSDELEVAVTPPPIPQPFAASVELPEGHQLIIGDLPPGTILEVATWEGVGRPDESTKRFLLSSDGKGLKAPQEKKSIESLSAVNRAPSVPAQSAFLGVQLPPGESATPISAPVRSSGYKKFWSRAGRALFVFVALISIVAMGANLAGISATVPTVGPKSFGGSSTNSLVLYKRSLSPQSSHPTVSIARLGAKKIVTLGPSVAFSETQLGIRTSRGIKIVDPNTVVGNSFAVIPYIGWLVKPLFH